MAPFAWANARVVLLEPADATGALRDALARTRAELATAGFEVVTRHLAANVNTREALAAAALETSAAAAITITSIRRGADVWVTDRVTHKTLVRTVDVGDLPLSEQPRALAIRAVELLRASFVEAVALPSDVDPAPPLSAELADFVTPRAPPLMGVALEMSGAFVTGFDGLGPAGGPAIRLSFGLEPGLFARLSWIGPVFGAAVTGRLGSAIVRQEMLSLDFGFAPHVEWRGFTPLVWAGGGFFHLAARGELQPEFIAQTQDVWSGALHGGAGIGYRVTPRFMVLLDAHALVLWPRPTVAMAGERLATTGRPTLVSNLGVVVRF